MMIYFLIFFLCIFTFYLNSLLVNYFSSLCCYCGYPVIPGLNCRREACPSNKGTNASFINSHNKSCSAVRLFLPHNHINATSGTRLFLAYQKRFYGKATSTRNTTTSGKQKANHKIKAKKPDFHSYFQNKTTKQNKNKLPKQLLSNKTLPFNKPLELSNEKTTLASKSIKVNTQALPILASPVEPSKIVGQSKHFPPANKEWFNSVYFYNKSSLRSLPGKDLLTKKLIKNYFNLSADLSLARSSRKRIKIRKASLNRLFVSRPEVKQTNDKIILNVYTYDRQRQSLLRKLFFNIVRWEKWRLGNLIYIKKPIWKKGMWVKKVVKVYRDKPNLIFFKKYNRWRKKRIHKFSIKNLSKKLLFGFSPKLKKPLDKSGSKMFHIMKSTNSSKEIKETKQTNYLTPVYKLKKVKETQPFNSKANILVEKKNNLKISNLKKNFFPRKLTLGNNIMEKALKHSRKLKSSKITSNFKLLLNAKLSKLSGFVKSNRQAKRLKKGNRIFRKPRKVGRKHAKLKTARPKKSFSFKPNRFFRFIKQRRPENEFIPKRIRYAYKPFLKGTWRRRSYRKYLRKRFIMFDPINDPEAKRRSLRINKKIPYFGLKHRNFMKYVSYIFNNKRLKLAKNMMLYYCNWYILSLLNIKILSFEETWDIKKKKLFRFAKTNKYTNFTKSVEFWKFLKGKRVRLKRLLPYYSLRFLRYQLFYKPKKDINFKIGNVKHKLALKNFTFKNFNYLLLKLIIKVLSNFNLKAKLENIIYRFSALYFLNIFKLLHVVRTEKEKKKRYKGIKYKLFHKKALSINYALKLIVNKSKFASLLLGLKTLLSKIYNKKAELNIVNLKYPHLNADIFSQAVAARLKKRANLLKVLRRSIQYAKLPRRFIKRKDEHSVNKFESLSYHKSLKLENLHNDSKQDKKLGLFAFNGNNIFQKTLNALYSHSLVNQPKINENENNKLNKIKTPLKKKNFILNKTKRILSSIKYKWLTGIRLEAKGRLTRRYTASKSIFKFKRKGSLQNLDFARRTRYDKGIMPNVVFRNLLKSNAQYSFVNGKRRVGAYGIKTWMGSY